MLTLKHMNPLISINISCLNRSEMLKECVNSFINQSFTDWELILVSDGSTEDLSFVEKMDKRIKYYYQEHGGMAKGLNLAMEKSNGEWLMPFGSDDLASDPNFLKEMVEAIKNNPHYDIFYCDHWHQYKNGRRIRIKYDNIGWGGHENLYKRMLKKQLISHGSTLWRKDKSPKYDENVAPADDWDLLLTAVENGLQFYHIPKRLWTYCVGHPRESGTKAMDEGCKKVLAKRGIKI